MNSPILTLGVAPNVPPVLHYNGNYFDATDPENRDNRQFAGSVAYFLSGGRWDSHDLKTGVEHFTSTLTGGNSQSATGLVFWADYVTNTDGSPAVDASGRLIPIVTPGVTEVENWLATRGATLDVRTLSLYAQDNWTVNRHLMLNLGLRYENARSEATGGIIGVDTQTLMPRLAATYDLMGDGRTILPTSYAHYSGKYSETQVGRNATVGNPALLLYQYVGPEGQGRDFAPGFDLANDQQPEADSVEHRGPPRSGQPARCQRSPDRSHPRCAVRPGTANTHYPVWRPGCGRTFLMAAGRRFEEIEDRVGAAFS